MRANWFHWLFLAISAGSPSLVAHADEVPVQSCQSCFDSSDVPLLSNSGFVGVDGQRSYFFVNDSPTPISNTYALQSSDSLAVASYSADFKTGFHLSEQTTGEYAEAYSYGFIVDFVLIKGATPGSTFSMNGNFDLTGTSNYVGGKYPTNLPTSSDYFEPVLFLDQETEPYNLLTGSNCQMYVYPVLTNFNGQVNDFCTATSPIPDDGVIQVEYDLASEIYAGNLGQASLIGDAFLSNFQVFDASGNPETGVSLYSESGTDYNAGQETSPVPENPSLLLMGTGSLAGLLSYLLASRRVRSVSN